MFCQSVTTPIIKPVNGLCNLSCSYCYTSGLKEYAGKNRMRPEILKAVIDFFAAIKTILSSFGMEVNPCLPE